MTQSANLPSEYTTWIDNMTAPVTPATNPELWYQWYEIIKKMLHQSLILLLRILLPRWK